MAQKKFIWDHLTRTKTYRYPHKGRVTRTWRRKRTSEKKGHMRYSSGPKWSGQFDFEKPAFWRTWQPELKHTIRDDEMLPTGYTRNDAWIALCKSWNGFMNAERESDHEEMRIFATQIRKLQADLELPLHEFDFLTEEEKNRMDIENDDMMREIWYATSV